jgi:hypothetical protein
MNKNSLLNQIYICPIGADGIQSAAGSDITVEMQVKSGKVDTKKKK